jgi:hypothetical protein
MRYETRLEAAEGQAATREVGARIDKKLAVVQESLESQVRFNHYSLKLCLYIMTSAKFDFTITGGADGCRYRQ